MPVLTVFAGPNGSGKSSIIRLFDFDGRENLLETDAIAARIDPDSPRRAAVAAGREVLRRTSEYIRSGKDFAIETLRTKSVESRASRKSCEPGDGL